MGRLAAGLPGKVIPKQLQPQQSPDAVINENTPAWPAEKLWHLVWPSCVVMSETFSPCDMGVPCNRVRRYTVVLRQQGRLKTMAPLNLETMSAMAFRQLRRTGSVFACAPQPLVKQRMDELAIVCLEWAQVGNEFLSR